MGDWGRRVGALFLAGGIWAGQVILERAFPESLALFWIISLIGIIVGAYILRRDWVPRLSWISQKLFASHPTILGLALQIGVGVPSVLSFRTRSEPERVLAGFELGSKNNRIEGVKVRVMKTSIWRPSLRRFIEIDHLGEGVVGGGGSSMSAGEKKWLPVLFLSQDKKAFRTSRSQDPETEREDGEYRVLVEVRAEGVVLGCFESGSIWFHQGSGFMHGGATNRKDTDTAFPAASTPPKLCI